MGISDMFNQFEDVYEHKLVECFLFFFSHSFLFVCLFILFECV